MPYDADGIHRDADNAFRAAAARSTVAVFANIGGNRSLPADLRNRTFQRAITARAVLTAYAAMYGEAPALMDPLYRPEDDAPQSERDAYAAEQDLLDDFAADFLGDVRHMCDATGIDFEQAAMFRHPTRRDSDTEALACALSALLVCVHDLLLLCGLDFDATTERSGHDYRAEVRAEQQHAAALISAAAAQFQAADPDAIGRAAQALRPQRPAA